MRPQQKDWISNGLGNSFPRTITKTLLPPFPLNPPNRQSKGKQLRMKLMILDGNSIINRAYYGIRMLTAPDGTPTNAVYGFLTILNRLLEDEMPDGVCVAFDLKAPTFRHERYDKYKAQRKAMPEELAVQLPILRETLDAMGIVRYELEGYEADDIIGTISSICDKSGNTCAIVTGDKDSFQLITESTNVLHVKSRMGQTETIRYDIDRFTEEYGFVPERIVDLKALMGDASDNIPGVPGVGEKTAMDLIRRFGLLGDIYADIDTLDIKDGVRKKLIAGEESAKLSYELATICRDVPVDFVPQNVKYSSDGFKDNDRLYHMFTRLGFLRFIEKWGMSSDVPGEAVETVSLGARGLSELLDNIGDSIIAVTPGETDGTLELCTGEACCCIAVDGSMSEALAVLFSDRYQKVCHNSKDIMSMLSKVGVTDTEGIKFDTALAAYLIEPTENNYVPGRLAPKYLGSSLTGARAVLELYPVLSDKITRLELDYVLFNIEMPLCRVLCSVEDRGFQVDRDALEEFGASLSLDIDLLTDKINDMAGEEFNINSPKQLGAILFDKLMLPHGKKTKTGWSTNVDVLEKLMDKHPIIPAIMEYRKLTKLKSTYVDGLVKVIGSDGRIHTSFQMTVTATGRLSSTEPNLQNIPIRTELGREMRKMFVAGEGMVLIDADYSQIELRLLAHISGDERMREAFLSGEDIHAVTASQVFNVSLSEVTPLMRSRAKAVNFGIVYGISDFSLSQDIGVTKAEAKEYIDSYFSKYSGVKDYMKDIVAKAKEQGVVKTLCGRARPMPELASSNYNIRSFGERVALNMPIQGTAADIIKLAMIGVYNRFQNDGIDAGLILQVHDELIVECPHGEADRIKDILKEEMEGAVKLSIPLTADVNMGKSWYDAK